MLLSEILPPASAREVFRANLLRLPADAEDESALQIARSLSSVFRNPRAGMEMTSSWLASHPLRAGCLGSFEQSELNHELSEYFGNASSEVFIEGRSLGELRVLTHIGLPAVNQDIDFQTFCDVLRLVKAATSEGQSEFRVQEIRTAPDRNGQCVAYPSASHIPEQLKRIHEHWVRHVPDEPGWAALVVMTALTNLHPFDDGNGRLGRILFNWTLNQRKEHVLYLPIYELAALSRGGYLIRLRQAQYHSQWEPLAHWLWLCAARLFLPSACAGAT